MKPNQNALRIMTWLVLTLTTLAFCGCGYSKSKYRKVDAQSKAAGAATADRDAYSKYRVEMEKVNLDREKAGLPLRPIATFEEWKKQGGNK